MDVLAIDPRNIDTDLVVCAAFEGQTGSLSGWSHATKSEIDRAQASKEFTGKLFETFLTPIVAGDFRARRLAAIGLGREADFTIDRARRVATAIGLQARDKKIARIAFTADGALDTPEMIQALAEGLTLAEFEAGHYKTWDYAPFRLDALAILTSERSLEAATAAVRRVASLVSTATWLARWTMSRQTF